MANEPIHGKGGKAKFDTTEFANEIRWTINLHNTAADSTAMHASNTGRTRVAGINGGTADVECYYLADASPEVLPGATAATLELWRAASDAGAGYYTGPAKCTGYDLGATIDGVETITYHFIFTDEVEIAII